MSDETTSRKSRKIKKAASSVKNIVKKPIVKKLFLVCIVIACAYGIFYLGQKSGAAQQKELDKRVVTSASQNSRSTIASRKTYIGTISSIDNKTIEITPRTGDKVKVTIDNNTRITGSDSKKTDAKALKKDQKVIVSSMKNKEGKYTATRIRIQR